METEKKYIYSLILAAIVFAISSCSSSPQTEEQSSNSSNISPTDTPAIPNTAADNSTLSPTPNPEKLETQKLEAEKPQIKPLTPNSPSPQNSPIPTPGKIAAAPTNPANRTINATLYTSDPQCQKLVAQKVELPANEPVESAVGKIIEKQDSGDFNLSGYRVNLKNGIATVDFRLSPNSQRQLSSLSSCEQFALFNSLRTTLTRNPQWKIKDVRFTEKGQEIVL